MIVMTGTVTVHHHGNSVSYSMLGCVVLLISSFFSVRPLMYMMYLCIVMDCCVYLVEVLWCLNIQHVLYSILSCLAGYVHSYI